jgi:phosphopantetheine adenylyltransferase
MSFSKTVSVVAALASIFSVGLASWKISEDIKKEQTTPLEQKIQDLEKKLEETKEPIQQPITSIPAPTNLPTTTQTQAPQLPPASPPPPVESQQ